MSTSTSTQCRHLETSAGTDLYYLGPDVSEGALPAFIYFSIGGEESLTLDPFNQPAVAALQSRLRVFSLDLPGHKPGQDKQKGIAWLAEQLATGNDPVTSFIDDAAAAVNELVNMQIIDPKAITVGGLSRGAFFAAHLAAKDPRIRSIIGFAPMTNLCHQKEFADLQENHLVNSLNLVHLTDRIFDRHCRFYIGNRDIAVGTAQCFLLVQALCDKAFTKKIRSPQIELFIAPSIGHRGHGTSREIFEDGAHWITKQLGVVKA